MGETGATTILLVEDQAIIAMAEADLLRAHDYDVVVAHSGEEAIRVFSETPRVDLVLMDINLGSGMDGTVTAERLLAARDLPIVFLSAYSDRKTVQRVRDITRYGYVVKNSGDFVLLSSIEMALDLFAAHARAALGERRLQRAQTLARLGSYERDKRTGETVWSMQVPDLLGDSQAKPSRERLLEAIHPDDRPLVDEAVRAAHASGDRFDVEYRIITPDGEERWIHDRAEYWRDSRGEPMRVFGVLQDITERKHAELSLQSRDEERTLLLREIHHRVKNNMETIESLLSLQSSVAAEQATRDALWEARQRLHTMMVLYDRLYKNDATGEIRIDEFLEALLRDLGSTYRQETDTAIELALEAHSVPVKTAILLGMIVNEAVTNALKYANPQGDESIQVALHAEDGSLDLVVQDHGPGIPSSVVAHRGDHFGLNLMYLLADQLGAEVSVDGSNGTQVSVRLSR